MAIYRVDYVRSYTKYAMVEANAESEAISKAIDENSWQEYPLGWIPTSNYVATLEEKKTKAVSPVWVSIKDKLPPVDKEAVVLTTDGKICFGHIVDKKIAKGYNGWNIPDVEYWLPFVNPKNE